MRKVKEKRNDLSVVTDLLSPKKGGAAGGAGGGAGQPRAIGSNKEIKPDANANVVKTM